MSTALTSGGLGRDIRHRKSNILCSLFTAKATILISVDTKALLSILKYSSTCNRYNPDKFEKNIRCWHSPVWSDGNFCQIRHKKLPDLVRASSSPSNCHSGHGAFLQISFRPDAQPHPCFFYVFLHLIPCMGTCYNRAKAH